MKKTTKQTVLILLTIVATVCIFTLCSCDNGNVDSGNSQLETYKITFKADGRVVNTQTYTSINKNITEPSVPTKKGYNGIWEDYTLTSGDKTVNAVYIAKQYTVTLNYNGATSGNTIQTITTTYEQPVGILPAPKRTGYEFAGWQYDSNTVTSTTIWLHDDVQPTLAAKWLTPTAGLKYALNSDGKSYSVTGIDSATDTAIIIPSTNNGKPVTSIGNHAFDNCSNITNITFPDNVTSIGISAFYGCNSLTNINYLGKIENWLKIEGLNNLMNRGSSNKTLSINEQSVTDLVIPNTVTSIPDYAFYKCINITNVTFEENSQCTTIGVHAFDSCKNLKSVIIHDGVTSINAYAFWDCSNLTSITIPSSVRNIKASYEFGSAAFDGCFSLAEINYLGTINEWRTINGLSNLMRAGSNNKTLSLNGEAVTELVIPNTVNYIPWYAFQYFTNITSVTFEENSQCTRIDDYAFRGCNNLASITIPNSVTLINDDAFYGCSSLTTIIFDGTVEQWNAITKHEGWNDKVPATKVICNDDEVAL